jgi:hypothetical protein
MASLDASGVREHAVERPGHSGEIKRADEQARVETLSAGSGPQETAKLVLGAPSLLRRLLLKNAERSELTLSIDDLFHRGGAEGADQLVLQIGDAHVETERFHLGAGQVGAEAGPLETTPKVALLGGVAQPRQPEVEPPRAEQIQEAADVRRTSHRHDGDAFSVERPTAAHSQSLKRHLVAHPFDENDRMRVHTVARSGRQMDGDGAAAAATAAAKSRGASSGVK